MSYGNVLKRPAVPEKKGIFMEFFEEQDAVLRPRIAASGWERSGACGVESNTESVKRQGKNISQPLGVP